MMVKLLSLYLFCGILLLSYLFVNSFSRGRTSYAKALGALSLALQIYLLGYMMEINATTLEDMLFWNQVQYFGIPFFPAFWLVVSILYTGRGKWLQGFGNLVVYAIPILTFIMRTTNQWHGLYYTNVEHIYIGDFQTLHLTKGPFYYVQMAYVLVALILCTWMFFKRYQSSVGEEKIQFRLLLIASILPYIALLVGTFNLSGYGIDFTALILPPSTYLINVALTRYNFLEISVLARERVFAESEFGLVLVNRFNFIVDYNEKSIEYLNWFGISRKEIPLEELLTNQQDLLKSILKSENKVFQLLVNEEVKFMSVKIREFQNSQKGLGKLVSFEDITERESLKLRLIEMASTDALSGLNNRRRFLECANDLYQRATRYDERLSVLMLDIDYFKKVNDTYGHYVGDGIIKAFSEALSAVFRESDIVGRMGGEEFAVIMINTNAKDAHDKAEYFRKLIENERITVDNQNLQITVSIGVAELSTKMQNMDTLINNADDALYLAKALGRNRTVVYSSMEIA